MEEITVKEFVDHINAAISKWNGVKINDNHLMHEDLRNIIGGYLAEVAPDLKWNTWVIRYEPAPVNGVYDFSMHGKDDELFKLNYNFERDGRTKYGSKGKIISLTLEPNFEFQDIETLYSDEHYTERLTVLEYIKAARVKVAANLVNHQDEIIKEMRVTLDNAVKNRDNYYNQFIELLNS